MFNAWENFPDTPYVLPNGTTIKVDEWRKEVKQGLAIIRSGYMRIDNCPRFQIVVIFNNVRVMTDRPIFRSFNDAQDAADEWLANCKNRPIQVSRPKLTALPSPDSVYGAEPSTPKPTRIRHAPVYRPEIMPHTGGERQRCSHTKLNDADSAKLDRITVEQYNQLDLARTSLHHLHSTISILMGGHITMAMVQQRLKKNNLPYKDAKREAVERAKPIIKEAIRQILIAYPEHGAKKCYIQLNRTEHVGYRFKLVNEMYSEVRKGLNTKASTHPSKVA